MRQKHSLFNRVCNFINSVDVDSTYKTKQYISHCSPYESEATSWKKKHPTYRTSQYQSYLKRAGFIRNVKRGEWQVLRHIPEWFDLGHLSIVLMYYRWDTEKRCDIRTYKGMSRTNIIAQLDEDTHRAMGLIPTHKANPSAEIQLPKKKILPKLYSTNRGVYNAFIEYVKKTGKVKFSSQNELYVVLENIKFPWMKNTGKKPQYAGSKNYDPIIAHLKNDGILTFDGYEKNRQQFTVYLPTVEYGTRIDKAVVQSNDIRETARGLANAISEICESYRASKANESKPISRYTVSSSSGGTTVSYKEAHDSQFEINTGKSLPTVSRSAATLESIMTKLDNINTKLERLEAGLNLIKTK